MYSHFESIECVLTPKTFKSQSHLALTVLHCQESCQAMVDSKVEHSAVPCFRSREHSLDRPSFKQTCHAVEGNRCGGVGCEEIVVREHQQQHHQQQQQQQHGSLPHSGPVSHHSSPGTSSGLGPGWSEDRAEDRTISRARAPSRARGEISSDEGGERHTLPRGGGGGQEPKVAEWGEVGLLDDKPSKNWTHLKRSERPQKTLKGLRMFWKIPNRLEKTLKRSNRL